jgi:uncharacterized protein with GYD domain
LKVIFEDTRQKPEKNAHIRLQLERLGYKVVRQGMHCGDYTWATDQRICIDTKQDLQEVCGNLTRQHERFQAECVRAQELGIKLIILVQESSVKSLADVPSWYNWRLKKNPRALNGVKLWKIMKTMSEKYDVVWEFTTKQECGRRIVELLGDV